MASSMLLIGLAFELLYIESSKHKCSVPHHSLMTTSNI
jgi:hypothetical protein